MFTTVYDSLMLTNSESCSEPICTVAIFLNITQAIWFPLLDIQSSDPHNLEKRDLFDSDMQIGPKQFSTVFNLKFSCCVIKWNYNFHGWSLTMISSMTVVMHTSWSEFLLMTYCICSVFDGDFKLAFYFIAKLNVRQHWLLVKQSTSISSCLPN